jgi:hypothetical protein
VGSHDIIAASRRLPWIESEQAFLGHFPLRSPGHHLAKIATKVLQYLVIPDRGIDAGWHYREAVVSSALV